VIQNSDVRNALAIPAQNAKTPHKSHSDCGLERVEHTRKNNKQHSTRLPGAWTPVCGLTLHPARKKVETRRI